MTNIVAARTPGQVVISQCVGFTFSPLVAEGCPICAHLTIATELFVLRSLRIITITTVLFFAPARL